MTPSFPEHEPTHPELPAPNRPRIWSAITELRQAARLGDLPRARQAAADLRSDQRSAPDALSLHHAATTPRALGVLLFLVDELGWSPDTRVSESSLSPAGPVALAALKSACWSSALALLERSSDPLGADDLSLTPLGCAAIGCRLAFEGCQPVVRRLLELGDNPAHSIPYGEHAGGNALHLCASSAPALRLFASLGLDLNAPGGSGGISPLAAAVNALSPSACLALLELGADPAQRSRSGYSVLHHLCYSILHHQTRSPQDPADWAPVFHALFRAGLGMLDPGPASEPHHTPLRFLSGGTPAGDAFAEAFLLAIDIDAPAPPATRPRPLSL